MLLICGIGIIRNCACSRENAAILLTHKKITVCNSLCLCFSAEIPGFLSEDECRVVMQLAQLKGLMESQLMVQDGQEELAKELNLSPEEIFNLLDINQDGQLQLHEVYVILWIVSMCVTRSSVLVNSSCLYYRASNRY